MIPTRIAALSFMLALPLMAKIPETMYKDGEAVYQAATLETIAEYFRTVEHINVLFKDSGAGSNKVTLSLHAVPKFVILQYAARAAGIQCAFKAYGAVFEEGTSLYQYRTPAGGFAVSLHKKISLEMENPTLEEILQLLTQVHKVNIVFVHPERWQAKTIKNLKLSDVSILQILTYLSDLFQVPVSLDKYAAFIGEMKKPAEKPAGKPKTEKKGGTRIGAR